MTEIFFDEALEAAKVLDASGDFSGRLSGIPVSLKDQFNVIGQDSTIGYVSGVGKPAYSNSCIVDSVIRQGGIIYCKTNVPQTVLTADTVNNLFGRTINPVNRNIIVAGSSGGEAALLACRGSILGIGTDTGGSIRIPSAACELYGLKPSLGRVSYRNVTSSNDGNISVISVAGPMARTLDSLEYFMSAMAECESWRSDHEVLAMPWRVPDLVPSKLTIGIMLNHGDFPPHRSFFRILGSLSEKLRSIGVNMITWESEELSQIHRDIAKVLTDTCTMDGGLDISSHLLETGEPLLLSGLVDPKNVRSILDVWSLNIQARELRNRYLDLWQSAKLDAVLTPTNPWAVLSETGYATKPGDVGYTGIFNLLDYSVVNFPAEVMMPEEMTEDQRGWQLDNFRIGCQVVCGRLQEEKAIAIAKIVADLL